MAFDVFISYSSKDKTIADAVCARLESDGIRCWIAPRDIVAGTSYGEAIIDAIHGARVMVLVFSSSANTSGHIPKEVERAVSNGVAILPFRIEDVAPGKSLDYFIGSVHWLDAMTPPMEKHLDDLAATVHKLLPASADDRPAIPAQPTILQHRMPDTSTNRASGSTNGPGSPRIHGSHLSRIRIEFEGHLDRHRSGSCARGSHRRRNAGAWRRKFSWSGTAARRNESPSRRRCNSRPGSRSQTLHAGSQGGVTLSRRELRRRPDRRVLSVVQQFARRDPCGRHLDRRSVHRALAPRERRTTRVHLHLARDGRNAHRLAGPTLHERR